MALGAPHEVNRRDSNRLPGSMDLYACAMISCESCTTNGIFFERRSSFALFNTSAAGGLLVESARGLKAFSPAFAARRGPYPRSCANSPCGCRKTEAGCQPSCAALWKWTGEPGNRGARCRARI